MVEVAYVVGSEGGIFFLVYWIGECGVGRHWRLLVTIIPLLRSYVRQWDIVVLDRHLVPLVLAALVMCWLYVCIVVLDRHLVL